MPEQMTKQDAIETLEIFRNDYTREDSAICRAIDIAIDALRQPTIEPEVRHGHWVFREEATPEYLPWDMWCSCCGGYHDSDDYNDRYCSICGAKMDGGADNA
jgi:hypothetical protein